MSNITRWINNVRKYLPTFKVVLYVEVDIDEDKYIHWKVKRFLHNKENILTIRKFPNIQDYPHYFDKYSKNVGEMYFLLGLKYISIFDYYHADNIVYRDLDSPITEHDSNFIATNTTNTANTAHVYLWKTTIKGLDIENGTFIIWRRIYNYFSL